MCVCILFYAVSSHGYTHVTTATVNILNSPSLHKGPMLPLHSHSHPPPDVTSDPWALELLWLPSLQGLPPASHPPLHVLTGRQTVDGHRRAGHHGWTPGPAIGEVNQPFRTSVSVCKEGVVTALPCTRSCREDETSCWEGSAGTRACSSRLGAHERLSLSKNALWAQLECQAGPLP